MTLESSPEVGKLSVNAHDTYTVSHLCTVCQRLDIRELLAQSEAQKSTRIETTLAGDHDEFLEYKPGLPNFFKHQNSLDAVKRSAESCTLCEFIFKSWSGSLERSEAVDKAIDDAGQGQLFIGTSGHSVSRSEIPIIIVTQKPEGHSSRTLCTFDVFSDRGQYCFRPSSSQGMTLSRLRNSKTFTFLWNTGRLSLGFGAVQSNSERMVSTVPPQPSRVRPSQIISSTHKTDQCRKKGEY